MVQHGSLSHIMLLQADANRYGWNNEAHKKKRFFKINLGEKS